jgi:hypothetical protein
MSTPTDYCCPVLELAVSREARYGLRWGTMVELHTGKSRPRLILEFPRSKDKKVAHSGATYAPIEYCPFCGARQTQASDVQRRRAD